MGRTVKNLGMQKGEHEGQDWRFTDFLGGICDTLCAEARVI